MIDQVSTTERNEAQKAPDYGVYEGNFSPGDVEPQPEEFTFSGFFLDKFPVATLIVGFSLSLYTAKSLANVVMFFGFLLGSTVTLAALPAILAGIIALPSAALLRAAKGTSFKRAFKPVFTILLYLFWVIFVITAFINSSRLTAFE